MPDALLAVIFAAVALVLWKPQLLGEAAGPWLGTFIDELGFGLMVELGFLMFQGSLIDVATRLRKRPPIWVIPIAGAALLVFSPYTLGVIREARGRGLLVLIPLLVSIGSRFSVMWHMPGQSREQKIAARALISNRMATGLICLAVFAAEAILTIIFGSMSEGWFALACASFYFAIAAIDNWRVLRPGFARNPRTLWRWDILGIQYLEPL